MYQLAYWPSLCGDRKAYSHNMFFLVSILLVMACCSCEWQLVRCCQ